jgi:two-component system, cell cycle sensor histidine kinase PleC
MSKSVSTSTDKNIVDRSKTHRNKAVAKAVKSTRERLQYGQGGNHTFDRDMLEMHISTALHGATIMPLFIVLVTGLGVYLTREANLVAWAICALGIHAVSLIAAKRANKQELTAISTTRWHNIFLAIQIITGCVWAYIAAYSAATTVEPAYFLFFKGATLLIALAIISMSNAMLPRAAMMTFLPVLTALIIVAATSRSVTGISLTAMFVVAMLFFHYLTDRLAQSNIKLLSFQSEKDDLIAELEVAKSMSDEARRRAEEANLAKSRFLASMSHELRTPLNAILGFSEVMATEVLGPLNNPLYKEYSGDIHRSGKHLLDLINEILDLSRIEAGRYDLHEETMSLLDLAEDCIGMIQLRARAKNISISQQFESSLPLVWADEKAIRQVILNLMSNAVKFTPQGGEIMMKVGWTAGGGQYISIKDNGPGIPEEEIPVVLSAFGQGSIAIKSAEQGTGLGLPIVQAILAKHDGQFILKSKLREGTEVIAILPAKRVLQSLPAVEDTQAVQPRKRSFA